MLGCIAGGRRWRAPCHLLPCLQCGHAKLKAVCLERQGRPFGFPVTVVRRGCAGHGLTQATTEEVGRVPGGRLGS